MGSLWDDIAKTIREGVDTVVGKTEEYTKIGKIKIDSVKLLEKELQDKKTELEKVGKKAPAQPKSTATAAKAEAPAKAEAKPRKTATAKSRTTKNA